MARPGTFEVFQTLLSTEFGKVAEMVSAQQEEREVWREHNTLATVLDLYHGEIEEFNTALTVDAKSFRYSKVGERVGIISRDGAETDGVGLMDLLAEAGDVSYLAVIMYQLSDRGFPSEMTHQLEVMDDYIQNRTGLEWNLAKCTLLKLARNALKYSTEKLAGGQDYEEAMSLARDQWEELGGDKAFYSWYKKAFNGRDLLVDQAFLEHGDWWGRAGGSREGFSLYYQTYLDLQQQSNGQTAN